jgi:hypothetical protein
MLAILCQDDGDFVLLLDLTWVQKILEDEAIWLGFDDDSESLAHANTVLFPGRLASAVLI